MVAKQALDHELSMQMMHLKAYELEMRGHAMNAQLSVKNEDLSTMESNSDAMCSVMRKMFLLLKEVGSLVCCI